MMEMKFVIGNNDIPPSETSEILQAELAAMFHFHLHAQHPDAKVLRVWQTPRLPVISIHAGSRMHSLTCFKGSRVVI
jgi:hypothetical protein